MKGSGGPGPRVLWRARRRPARRIPPRGPIATKGGGLHRNHRGGGVFGPPADVARAAMDDMNEATMPGSGTDKTKDWIAGGPIVVLVEPQLGDNVGAAARAMANFGLSRLRLIKPRDGWPNPRAWVAASGADPILDEATLHDTIEAAIADCTYVLATTARAHDQAKPVIGPAEAARVIVPRVAAGELVAVLFGRERYGLENTEVSLADAIVTFPVNPAFASLNL